MRRHVARAPPRSVVLAEDGTDLRLFPPRRAGRAVRGQPAPVPISGGNAERVLLGALDLARGHRLFLVRKRQRGVDAQLVLEGMHDPYRAGHVVLLAAGDSSHTAADARLVAEDLGTELLWLPKRSPHLNPTDHLGRHGRAVKGANHQHDSIETQAEEFVGYLQGWGTQDALRKAGVLSPAFWPKG